MGLPPDRYDYCPLIDRPRIAWPNGARVAFWVSPNVEHYEYLPRFDGVRNPWPRSPYPDVQGYSSFDYGNRVGFWRMLEVLDKHRIRYLDETLDYILSHDGVWQATANDIARYYYEHFYDRTVAHIAALPR